jgi:hypothetical protein
MNLGGGGRMRKRRGGPGRAGGGGRSEDRARLDHGREKEERPRPGRQMDRVGGVRAERLLPLDQTMLYP